MIQSSDVSRSETMTAGWMSSLLSGPSRAPHEFNTNQAKL